MPNSFGNFGVAGSQPGETKQRIQGGDTETKLMRAEDRRGYLEVLDSDQLYQRYSSHLMLGAIHQVSKSATYHYSCWPTSFAEEFDTLVKGIVDFKIQHFYYTM